jgi:transposase
VLHARSLGLFVGAADRARLAAIVADRNRPQKHVWRAEVVLLTADRLGTTEIMRRTGLSKPSVWRWQERYLEAGVDGLLRDKTRPSRIPALSPAKVADVVRRTLDEAPPGEATHWTVRAMAEASGVSTAKVHEIWREAGLAPHRVRRFKLSNDPAFAEKLEDVIGLYVDPPRHAIVLSLKNLFFTRRLMGCQLPRKALPITLTSRVRYNERSRLHRHTPAYLLINTTRSCSFGWTP